MAKIKTQQTIPEGWTEGRLNAFIVGVLRQGHKRWPYKYIVKNEAKTDKKINPESNRLAQFYQCAICKDEFTNKEVEVDHIEPVVDPVKGFINWDTFIARLFSFKENYQLVCKSCHKLKSNKEKKARSK